MKEYRIVADVDTKHGDGREYHYEAVTPWRGGTKFTHHPYKTKSDALRVCKFLRQKCKEFDKRTQENFKQNPRDCIAYTQTNIRVQMREVTEWEDVK